MIQALIFSKDRPLQLDGCLTSLLRHAAGTEGLDSQVIYDGSSSRFLKQYDELAHSFSGQVEFVHQADFKDSVLLALRRDGDTHAAWTNTWWRSWRTVPAKAEAARDVFILFLVDDTVFVRPFDAGALGRALTTHQDALGVSLRLGMNTTESYAMERRQLLPKFEAAAAGLLSYDWTTADGDFGYPLEISSSVYRLADLLPLLGRLDYHDPNTLESNLSLQAKRLARKKPVMLCPEISVAFSAPVNRVQQAFENRSGSNPKWTTEQLADKFDKGIRINVAKLDGFTPSACHQEVELPLESRT